MSETISTTATPAPEPVVAPAAVVAPVVTETPVVVAPAEAPAPVEAAPAPDAAPTSILGDALKPADPAPVVEAAPEPVAPEGQSVEPAPPPAFEPFALPDGVTALPERMAEFTGLLGELTVQTKADAAVMQQFGQKLMDRHVAEVQRVVGDMKQAADNDRQRKLTTWVDEFRADPEIGGNRQETSVAAALDVIRQYGGTPEQQAQLRKDFDETGAGNKASFIRLLVNLNAARQEGRPLVASAPAPQKPTKIQAMYGGSR